MEHPYSTLKTVYQIVKEQSNPKAYPCLPEQLIVYHSVPWDVIQQHLAVLSQEGLVECKQMGKLAVYLTDKGMEKVSSLDALQYI